MNKKKFFMPDFERPVRIPKSVKIEKANPPFAIAQQYGQWELKFIISKEIKENEVIKFQISAGRNIKGPFPVQAKNPDKEGYITAWFKGEKVKIEETEDPQKFILRIPGKVKKGDVIKIILGDKREGSKGTRAPKKFLNKFFILYKDEMEYPEHPGGVKRTGGFALNNENQKKIISACIMHILGGEMEHLRAYIPSSIKCGEKFTVLIRPEDKDSYLSPTILQEEKLKVFAGDKKLEGKFEKIKNSNCIKFITKISEEGIYRLKVKYGKYEAITNPAICSKKSKTKIYWGNIHGHTENSDGHGSIDYYFYQMKNECLLNFAAPGDHDHLWETPDGIWENTCETVKKWNKENEFITFSGYEWAKWRQNGDGDRNVYYFYDNRKMYRSDFGYFPAPCFLFKALKKEKAIIIPHHTGHRGNWCDFKEHDEEKERLIEIFQVRGSYEFYERSKNPCPEAGTAFGKPVKIGFVNNALKMGWRVGFTSGGDDHTGNTGTEAKINKYKQGALCVYAKNLTRKEIWAGLWRRRTVATTGARIILFYKINRFSMGDEIPLSKNRYLEKKRKFYIEFHGTSSLKQIDIIRNGEILKTFKKEDMDLTIEWEDRETVDKIFLPPERFSKFPFIYYYVRAIQKDSEVAWASPIWIVKE